MPEWGAQSFQAVWFFGTQRIDLPSFFEAVVGAKPDIVQQQTVGLSFAAGSTAETQFRCQFLANRADFLETPSPKADGAFPLYYDIDYRFSTLMERLTRGSVVIGEANRLSLVTTMMKRADTRQQAIDEIAGLINLQIPFDDSSDVVFQINRRLASASRPEVLVNRLLRWQVQTLSQVELRPEGPSIKNVDFASLVADINSVQAAQLLFQPAEQVPIWQEMRAEAERICLDRSLAALST